MSNLISKRFVIRQSLVGKNVTIEFTNKKGKKYVYNHDKAFNIMKSNLEKMACFIKYKSYTATNNIPVVLRDKELVQSLLRVPLVSNSKLRTSTRHHGVQVRSILTMSTKYNNMIYTLNTHCGKEIDLTWAIGLQMEDKLTRADVLGIIETHQNNSI